MQLRAVVIDAIDNGAEAELKLHPRNLVRRLSHKHALALRHQQPLRHAELKLDGDKNQSTIFRSVATDRGAETERKLRLAPVVNPAAKDGPPRRARRLATM